MYQFHNENTPYYFFKKNIETSAYLYDVNYLTLKQDDNTEYVKKQLMNICEKTQRPKTTPEYYDYDLIKLKNNLNDTFSIKLIKKDPYNIYIERKKKDIEKEDHEKIIQQMLDDPNVGGSSRRRNKTRNKHRKNRRRTQNCKSRNNRK